MSVSEYLWQEQQYQVIIHKENKDIYKYTLKTNVNSSVFIYITVS